MKKDSQAKIDKWPTLLLVGISLLLMGGMIWLLIAVKTPTSLESGLMTFILTAASSILSYLVSKMFAERGFDQTMRDHGVQIARGIIELKNQMSSLAEWVGAKRQVLSPIGLGTSAAEAALEHIELTLQGFRGLADNAVGGIAGVIGDAYSQYEDFIDQVGRFRSEAQIKTSEIEREIQSADPSIDTKGLQDKIDQIIEQTERKIVELARTSALPIPPAPVRRTFSTPCPFCANVNSFEMAERSGETKSISCRHCRSRFNAHLSTDLGIFTRPVALVPADLSNGHIEFEPWGDSNKVEEESRVILHKTQAYVDPRKLGEIVGLVVGVPKQEGESPFELQARILANNDKSVANSAVRIFFKMVFQGGAFQFGAGGAGFTKAFENTLSTALLEEAFARGVLRRLSRMRPLSVAHTETLAVVIFGERAAEFRPVVEEILADIVQK